MEKIYQNYHKITGKILFPVRLLLIPFTILSSTALCIVGNSLFPKSNTTVHLIKKTIDILSYLFCVDVNIIQDEHSEKLYNYEDGLICIYNHIHPYDIFPLIQSKEKIMSFLMNINYNFPPINYFSKKYNFILHNKNKKTDCVTQIKNHVNEKHTVCIAPDSCNIIPKDKYIASFKNGSFIPKQNIIPIVIRHIPSTIKRPMNWGNGQSLRDNIFYGLFDGHIQTIVKVLPEEKWSDDYKTHEEYRDNIHTKMESALKELPSQTPSRIIQPINQEKESLNNLYYLIYNIILFFIFHITHYNYAIYPLLITGFFKYNYATINTDFFHKIFMYYTLFHMIIH